MSGEAADPDEAIEALESQYRDEIKAQEPDTDRRRELGRQHLHHLVRQTTSQYTETDVAGPVEIKKTAEVPDLYCFTCEEWVGVSGVDLRGTPRSRKDAYYLGGPPEAVKEVRSTVRDTLADLVEHISGRVPHVDGASDALEFIDGEVEQAQDRVTEGR